jgi:hypothetical protein
MKTIKLIIVILAIIFISCEETYVDVEQFGAISGIVVDGDTHRPLEYVEITTSPASTSLFTDETGKFIISKVKVGDVIIKADRNKDDTEDEDTKYHIKSITVAVFDNETTPTTFSLKKDKGDLAQLELFNPTPSNGAVNQDTTLVLSWEVSSNNKEMLYDVYYYTSDTTIHRTFGQGLTEPKVNVVLQSETTYTWYVEAYDKLSPKYKINSIPWTFTTKNKE